jgi:hypothetical protein
MNTSHECDVDNDKAAWTILQHSMFDDSDNLPINEEEDDETMNDDGIDVADHTNQADNSDEGKKTSNGDKTVVQNGDSNSDALNNENRKRPRQENLDRHEEARRMKRERLAAARKIEMDGQRIHDVNLEIKRTFATALWEPTCSKIRMIQIKGNFWKNVGHHDNADGYDYLHLEEALMLVERAQLLVQNEAGERLTLKDFYEFVLQSVELPCYMTYTKLKALEYVIYRHNHHTPKCLQTVEEIKRKLYRTSI